MNVYWLEQTLADVPADDHWLSANESARLHTMRFPKRRADWRLGRWTAKCAIRACLNMRDQSHDLPAIEVLAAPSGEPEVFVGSQPAALTISISHRDGRAACAVAMSAVALGCDLETVEPHSDGFVTEFFTAEEQVLVARAPAADRPCLLALMWSAKESALKALHEGLRLDTRSVIVDPSPRHSKEDGDAYIKDTKLRPSGSGWQPLQVRYANGQTFQGWWQLSGELVRTLVAVPPPAPPVPLKTFAAARLRGESDPQLVSGVRYEYRCD